MTLALLAEKKPMRTHITFTCLVVLALLSTAGCLPEVTSANELNRQLALARRQSDLEKEELRTQLNQARRQGVEHEEWRVRVETVERDSAALVARISALETERDGLAREVLDLHRVRDEAETLAVQAREARERAAALERDRDQVRRELQQFVDLGGVGVDVTPDGIRISMPDAILFDSGKDELKPEAAELLKQVADVVKRRPAQEIRVAGHTDTAAMRAGGRFVSNWELSTARALSVVHRLVEAHGIPASRVVALGFGENRPVATNISPEGRSLNRRVEIFLIPKAAVVR